MPVFIRSTAVVFRQKEVLNEVRYLRQTVAPNIREKRKVDKKFIKYSKEELIQQIKGVLKPENEELGNLDILLKGAIKEPMESPAHEEEQGALAKDVYGELVGAVGIFDGPLGVRKVGVDLAKETIQFYQPTRYGFQPEYLTSDICDWKLKTKIDDFDFISRRTSVYLRCAISKTDLK